MGRASSSKKVSRIAGTGGGRVGRANRPYGWYAFVAIVVILGVAGIVFSRDEHREELAGSRDLSEPLANETHWHAAYGVYLCDGFAPPIQEQHDPKGIHTHGDGVIHVHPFRRSVAGRNAVLSVFADAVDMTLTESEIKLPGGESFKEGEDECDGEPGIVQVKVDGEIVTEDVRNIRFSEDRMVMTIAFAPRGAEIPDPPSVPTLGNLSDVPADQQQPPPTTPGGEGSGGTEGGAEGTAEDADTGDTGEDTTETTAEDSTTSAP